MRRLVTVLLALSTSAGVTIGFAAAAIMAFPSTASAHDVLEKTTPGEGTSVEQVPAEVVLVFSQEPLEIGLQVVVTRELFEGADTDAAWALLARAADGRGDAVLSSHGDVIPDLIRRAQLRGMEIPGRSGCGKGSCWTLTGWDGQRFARGDYAPNPH